VEPSASGVAVEEVVVLRPYPVDGTTVPAAAKLLIANNIVAAEINVFKIFIAYISFFVMPYDNKREKMWMSISGNRALNRSIQNADALYAFKGGEFGKAVGIRYLILPH
jgi:hypothetical protein